MGPSLSGLRFRATTCFVFLAGAGLCSAVVFPGGRPFFGGVSLAAILEIPSYWALSLTLRRSSGKFFGAFVGGMFGRMAGLSGGVALVWRFERAAVVPFVLAAAGGLIGFSFIESYFIGRQNRLPL